jgi:DNA-binding GntR family transcriptional regulator
VIGWRREASRRAGSGEWAKGRRGRSRLRALDQELRRLAADGDLLAWNTGNTQFYRSILACCHSQDLVDLIDLQRDRSPLLRHFPEVLAERAAEQNVTRRALLDAIRRQDGATAERLQKASITRGGVVLCTAMRTRDLLSRADSHGPPAPAVRDGVAAPVVAL